MMPQGPPTPLGGGQPIPPSLLRSNSGLLGGQGAGMPSQNAFSSLVSPRNQFNNMNMLGNVPNVSSLLHQSFGNGGPGSGLPGPGSSQRGLIDGGAECDPLSNVGTGMGFNHPSSSLMSSSIAANPNSSGQVQGQQQLANTSGSQMLMDQQQSQQLDPQNVQHNQQQFSVPSNPQQQPQPQQPQQQFQAMRAGLGGVRPVKLEPQVTNEQAPQQLQAMRNLGSVKLEPQQLQSVRSLGPVKMELQHSDPSLFLQQQQQQQQQLLLSRQSSQAAAAAQILHQQRLMQIQHQQQQQLLKSMPQQRSQLQPQFQPQNLPIRSPVKPVYEPGMGARRLTHYMYQQQHRPEDNNIEFWRKFVAEYFAPNAKKKWCVSMYGSGRQTTGVFPQDVWHCEICNRKPGRGFEATVEVLPRLFKIKYESGTLEELLYVDMPREYQNSSGQIVLDYAKAIQESVFEQLRVVRDGQLRIVFSPDLKICSWEFCARRHEELIPRRLLIPQVSQLGAAAQKCQSATQNSSTNVSASELQNNCNLFVASARQLAKALEVPLVNDLGYTKRYVRCLQISEVVNSMKDLIDYSRETGVGPMESLTKFPRKTNTSPGFQDQAQQPEGQQQQQKQQTMGQNSNIDNSVQATATQRTSINGIPSLNNTMNSVPATSSTGTIAGLLHQNSINSRQQNPISGSNSSYGGNGVQMPSPGSSSTMPQTQPAPSPFQSPTPASSNNPQPTSHSSLSGAQVNSVNSPNISMQQPSLSGDADANDSQSSVQKIIQDMMMSSQLGGGGMMGMGTMGSDMKNVNGMLSASSNAGTNGSNTLVGNGLTNGNPGIGGSGFGSIGNGLGQTATVNGIRSALGNNSLSMNGRAGITMAREQSMNQQQQQDLGNQLLSGLGAVNGFNNLQFDWKASP
ncbi:transcriptional corepressor SEUSS-like [Sesamum indicum]|uniref:Transcriptional corepressor SEUSS-like n=1 Tax=Sesamum indicum TaxID=4182 RepID=A0A8M8UUI3_SESIN|nr:transcriptional corepressor SEUSS-like [Sesamum indicum]XP_020547482.1 transcriptional corepressor SEUSS-like [Sesamum indicum]XP_020547483.1 transcriptional corepressor SEUSS-like [Sesamum indicum]